LTGRDSRVPSSRFGMAQLFSPLSLSLAPVRFFFPEVLLEQHAASLHALDGHHDRFGRALGVGDVAFLRAADPLRPSHALSTLSPHIGLPRTSSGEQRQHHFVDFVLVVSHRTPDLEFAARVALRDSDNHRTNAGQSADAAREASAALMLHTPVTLVGSTRLHAERPAVAHWLPPSRKSHVFNK